MTRSKAFAVFTTAVILWYVVASDSSYQEALYLHGLAYVTGRSSAFNTIVCGSMDQHRQVSLYVDLPSHNVLTTKTGMAVGCSSSPKHVALTFDDGPSPHTSKVLKTLAEANVTATFFVAGASDEEYSLVEKTRWLVEIQASGHQVESHTWVNPAMMNTEARSNATQMETLQSLGRGSKGH